MVHEVFNYSLLVLEHHLDTFGHVNNATYLELLEEARWDFVNSRGFSVSHIQKKGMGPVVLEWQMKFRKEIKLRERITIKSQLQSYEGKVGILKQDIYRDETNDHCFEGIMTFGLFDINTRKLIPPTTEWLYALGIK